MKEKKNHSRLILSIAIVIVLTVVFSIGEMPKGVKRAVQKNENKNQITATFRYLDDKGNPVHSEKVVYVFLTSKKNDHRKTFKLQANSTSRIVLEAYDQNGSNKHPLEDDEYDVVVATQKTDQNVQVTDSTKFDQNQFTEVKDGQIVNGSYKLTIIKNVDMRNKNNGSIEIIVRSLEGRKYTTEEVLPKLDLADGFGVFARNFWLNADIESTIAVEKAHTLESYFGLSQNNYNGFYDSSEVHKIVVSKKYVKYVNNVETPASGEEVTILLNKSDDSTKPLKTQTCVTDEKGRCNVSFEDVKAGSYSISEKVNGNIVSKTESVQDENGNNVTVTIPDENNITISKQNVNYNYIGDADENIQVEKFTLREPGTLVVDSQNLYDKLNNNEKFNGSENKIKLVKSDTKDYPKIDFNSEFDSLNDVSVKLVNAIDSDDIKVYYLTADQIKEKKINFSTDKKEYIIVNVDCTGIDSNTRVEVGGENLRDGKSEVGETFVFEAGSKVIYNFYQKDGDNVKPFEGTIETKSSTAGILLVPSATVYGATGNHSGTIIAKDYHHTTGEVHQQFRGYTGTLSISNSITVTEQDVDVNKIDALNNPVKGAKMQLINSAGKIIEEWTTNGTSYKIKTTLKKGQKYIIREAYSPEGYQPSKDVEFTYSGNIENHDVIDTQLIVNKYDENHKYLSGATLQIVDENGYVLEEWVSDGTQHIVKESLNPGQKYFLHEKYAPLGYKESKDVEFVLDANGKNQIVEMTDEKLIINVSIKKTDWNEKLLAGAHLQIFDSKKSIIEDWVSDGTEHKVNANLTVGETYILHEVSAPEGYEITKDVEFKVENTEKKQVVRMLDNKIRAEGQPFAKILKTDIDGKLLEGAELQLLDSNGKVIEEWTSNDKAHNVDAKLEAGKQYTLHEKKAPTGYQKAGDVTFTTSSDKDLEITMIDERIRRVEGVVETVDEIVKYMGIFTISLVLLLGLFIGFTHYNKKKLSQ